MCCYKSAFASCILLLGLIIRVRGNPMCYKRLPEIATENCCSLPSFYTESIKEKCNSSENNFKLEIGSNHLCFISCAFHEMGIFNNDEFQPDLLESYLNEAIPDSMNIKADMKVHFQECVNNYKQLGNIIPKEGHCPALVMDCVFIKTFKTCPDSIWSNTDDCNTIREHWRYCLPDEL